MLKTVKALVSVTYNPTFEDKLRERLLSCGNVVSGGSDAESIAHDERMATLPTEQLLEVYLTHLVHAYVDDELRYATATVEGLHRLEPTE